jgi:hypothetical protein
MAKKLDDKPPKPDGFPEPVGEMLDEILAPNVG